MPTVEETEVFIKITGLYIIKEQMITKKDVEKVHRKIDQILELIR